MNSLSVSPPSTCTALGWVVRGVFLETLRRKDFYVLAILVGLLALGIGILSLVGVEEGAAVNFTLNLGMSFAYYAAHLLTLLLAARQIPTEIESRQIFPLLAKPIKRPHYIIGKWIATSLTGTFALFVFLAMIALAMLMMPKGYDLNSQLLAQALLLFPLSLALLAALVMLGSLLLPKGFNIILMGLLWAGGTNIVSFARSRAVLSSTESTVDWVTGYIPQFSKLNLITRYTDGVDALGTPTFLGLLLYGLIITAAALSLSGIIFERRSL